MATTTKNVAYPHGSILIFLPHICLAAPLFFFNLISKYCVSKVNVVSVILDYLGFVFFFLLSLLKRKKNEKGTNASFLRHNIMAYFCNTLK